MTNDDFSIKSLTKDQIAVAERNIREVGSALGIVLSMLKTGRPLGDDDEAAKIIPLGVRNAMNNLMDLAQGLGVPLEAADERKRRVADLRKANFAFGIWRES